MARPRKRPKTPLRQRADEAFGTFVRYAGFLLMVYAALVDRGRNPALIPAATGMIIFKTVVGDGGRE